MGQLREVAKRRVLRSWKEIGAELGVTVRTVQRWEKMDGLPVYRQAGGRKARVYAYSDELQRWTESGPMPAREPGDEARPRSLWVGLTVAGALLLVLTAAVVARFVIWAERIPHAFRIQVNRLRVEDDRQRLCWEKTFPGFDATFEIECHDKALVADIDGDGRIEVLFNYLPPNLAETGGSLICYEQNGRVRWEHHYGSVRTFGNRTFAATYRGSLLRAVNVSGKPRILAVANHYIWYPAQAVLLNPASGRVEEEYWHPGSINRCSLRDIDGDGREEVLLGAINNPGSGLGHAALIALKLPFSAAPKTANRQHAGLAPLTGGGELAYRLFPTPDTNRVLGILPRVALLGVEPGERILVATQGPKSSAVVYYLNFKLEVEEVRFSDDFAATHDLCYRQHLLDHRLLPREEAALRRVVALDAAPDGNSPLLAAFWAE